MDSLNSGIERSALFVKRRKASYPFPTVEAVWFRPALADLLIRTQNLVRWGASIASTKWWHGRRGDRREAWLLCVLRRSRLRASSATLEQSHVTAYSHGSSNCFPCTPRMIAKLIETLNIIQDDANDMTVTDNAGESKKRRCRSK